MKNHTITKGDGRFLSGSSGSLFYTIVDMAPSDGVLLIYDKPSICPLCAIQQLTVANIAARPQSNTDGGVVIFNRIRFLAPFIVLFAVAAYLSVPCVAAPALLVTRFGH